MHAIAPFALERWFARWEFAVRHNLCASDVEPWTLDELLALADDDARARWRALSLGYTESGGLPALREAIASTYEDVAPDQVLTFAGAEEGIFLTMHALLASGDHAVVVVPAYQSLHEVARSAGADVTEVPLDPADWSLDVEAVRRAVRPRTRVVVVNFPHSPTGALPHAGVLSSVADIAADAGACLFSDEVYRGLELRGAAALPQAADRWAHAVSLGVMSKAYGLAGLRIGWIATRDDRLRARVAALKDYTTICSSAPSEVLALIALRARERLLERARGIVEGNFVRLERFMARHEGRFAWVPPRAGSVAFPRLHAGDAATFAERLLAAEETLLLPGALFGADPRHFRVGLGRRDFAAGLERLDRFISTGGIAA